jgi:hypothetical protein
MKLRHPTKVRFAVIGINHAHIYGQVNLLLRAGAELVSVFAREPDLLATFITAYPQAIAARSLEEILEDETIQLVVGAAIPAERAAIGIAALKHGKDYMSDKPGFTTLEQLAEARRVQAETGRIYSICFCNDVPLPYGPQLLDDIVNRTETAMTQAHCFLASELVLRAEAQASRLGYLVSP